MKVVKFCLVFFLVVKTVVWSWECREKPSSESIHLLTEFCNGTGTIKGRECLNSDNATIGLDLSRCELKNSLNLNESVLDKLQWIAINYNDLTLNKSVSQLRSKALNYVVVSTSDDCRNFHNETVYENVKLCSHPVNACPDEEKKDPCPKNSICHFDGPGLFTCDCAKDWQSYKCLKQARFPYEKWLISIGAATIVFIVVVRCLQHKDLKRGEEFKELARQSTDTSFGNPDNKSGVFE